VDITGISIVFVLPNDSPEFLFLFGEIGKIRKIKKSGEKGKRVKGRKKIENGQVKRTKKN